MPGRPVVTLDASVLLLLPGLDVVQGYALLLGPDDQRGWSPSIMGGSPQQTILLTLVIGGLETVPHGPLAFRLVVLDMREGLTDHKVRECGAGLAGTRHW